MRKTRVLTVFGTRPEAIKMAPIILEGKKRSSLEVITCITAQHREMIDQVLEIFGIEPDFDLDIFQRGQTLTDITINALRGLEKVIEEVEPDILLVQGDTTSVFSGALAAFYQKVKVGHVEAGLRSGNNMSPYPEEVNRKLTGIMTNFHFCPTKNNLQNLLDEGYKKEELFTTGNTVIDALYHIVEKDFSFKDETLKKLDFKEKRIILLTSHRRENIGKPMENVFRAVNDLTKEFDDVEVVFPVHLNPVVREIAKNEFSGNEKVHLIEPLGYQEFANLIKKCHFLVSDSGGLQEEAPALGKPVLVIREETERPEGVEAGTCKLVGTKYENVYKEGKRLLDSKEEYEKMSKAVNPYGDGKASEHILDIIEENF